MVTIKAVIINHDLRIKFTVHIMEICLKVNDPFTLCILFFDMCFFNKLSECLNRERENVT